MKLLVIADVHGEEVVLDKIKDIHKKYDYVVIAGDLTDGSLDFAKRFFEIKNILFVPGNADPPLIERTARGIRKSLHKNLIKLDSIKLIGFGYSNPTPFRTPGELSEAEIYRQIKNLPIDEQTILVTHVPPYGLLDEVNDMHIGSRSLRKIVDERKPRLHVFGHVHEIIGKKKFGNVTLINIPSAMELKGLEINIEKTLSCEFVEL